MVFFDGDSSMIGTFDWKELFNYGVPTALLVGLFWYLGKPWSDYLRLRAETKAALEDERDRKLTDAVQIGTETMRRLADNGDKLSQAYSGLEAILKSEVEIAKVTRTHIQNIKDTVGEGKAERAAIAKAIGLVETLDAVPTDVQEQLAEIRRTLQQN